MSKSFGAAAVAGVNAEPNPIHRRGWLMMLLGWALAFFICTAFYRMILQQQYNPNQLSVISQYDGELILEKNKSGHYLTEGMINGEVVTFLIDTGASQVAVPQALAQRAGLRRLSPRRIQTAAGAATAWETDIDELQIGFIVFKNLRGVIVPDLELDVVLLGMNALERLEINQQRDALKLRPAQ